jgi:hypothetical protein
MGPQERSKALRVIPLQSEGREAIVIHIDDSLHVHGISMLTSISILMLKSQEYGSDLYAQHNVELIAIKITMNSVGHKPPIYARIAYRIDR